MVDPTDDERRSFAHPLTQRYRPRFTASEITIINLLYNRAPEPVSIGELKRAVAPFCYYDLPTDDSFKQLMVRIRSKIGEPKGRGKTRHIIPVREEILLGNQTVTRIVGYRWVDGGTEP